MDTKKSWQFGNWKKVITRTQPPWRSDLGFPACRTVRNKFLCPPVSGVWLEQPQWTEAPPMLPEGPPLPARLTFQADPVSLWFHFYFPAPRRAVLPGLLVSGQTHMTSSGQWVTSKTICFLFWLEHWATSVRSFGTLFLSGTQVSRSPSRPQWIYSGSRPAQKDTGCPVKLEFHINMLFTLFCCSVAQSHLTLCNPMDYSTLGFPVLHCLLEFA